MNSGRIFTEMTRLVSLQPCGTFLNIFLILCFEGVKQTLKREIGYAKKDKGYEKLEQVGVFLRYKHFGTLTPCRCFAYQSWPE